MLDYAGWYVIVDDRAGCSLPVATLEEAKEETARLDREYPEDAPHALYMLMPEAYVIHPSESLDKDIEAICSGVDDTEAICRDVDAHIVQALKAKPLTVWIHRQRPNRVSGPLEFPEHVHQSEELARLVLDERGGLMQEFTATGRDMLKGHRRRS